MIALTNKALAVLEVLRGCGEISCKDLAARVMAATPCGHCDGTGEGDDSRYGCRSCYGRGQLPFYYSDCYVCLQQLMKRDLVSRRFVVNEWGDVERTHVYVAVSGTVPRETGDDPLEALFAAPSAEVDS